MQSIRRQEGWIMIMMMMALVVMASITLRFSNIKTENAEMEANRQQGVRIANIVGAIRHAVMESTALGEFATAGARFQNGAVHVGTSWLKPTTCTGGTAPEEHLRCAFENEPLIGDGVQYTSTITNDGTKIIAVNLVIGNAAGTVGFQFNGQNLQYRSCAIARAAEGAHQQSSSAVGFSDYHCDPDSGVITVTMQQNVAASDFIHRGGLNSPTADIDWGGFELQNVSDVTASRVVDRDDTNFILDMDDTSIFNDLEVDDIESNTGTITTLESDDFTTIDASVTGVATIAQGNIAQLNSTNGTITTLSSTSQTTNDLTVTNSINQTNAAQSNNIAGSLKIGVGPNDVDINNGSIYLDGALIDSNDDSYFFDPDGVSRFKDGRITARGGVRLSTLLPNYVNKGSVNVVGWANIPRVNCADGGGYNASRIVIAKQDETSSIHDSGANRSDSAKSRVQVNSNASNTMWNVQLLKFNLSTWNWEVDSSNRALATVFCYYP